MGENDRDRIEAQVLGDGCLSWKTILRSELSHTALKRELGQHE